MSKHVDNLEIFPGRNRADSALELARKLSVTIGLEFFGAIAKHLAVALEADCIYLGEFAGGLVERVKALAAYVDGVADTSEYPLPGSASAEIAAGKEVLSRANVRRRFPDDQLLARLSAQSCVGIPLHGAGGQPLGVMMAVYRRSLSNLRQTKSMLDIFAARASAELVRKLDEDQLRESAQRYRAFISRNTDAMWRIEFEQPIPTNLPALQQLEHFYQYGYIAECNDALARLAGATKAEELVGSRIEILAPRSNASVVEATLRAIQSEYRYSTVETAPFDADGKQRHMLRTQWGIVDDGKLQRMWGINRDISQLRRSELALDASEQRLADLLESMHLAVVMLSPDGSIAFCNDYLYRLTGWQPADVVGKDFLNLMIPPDDRVRLQAALEMARHGEKTPIHLESTLLGPQGQRWWMAWDIAVLFDSEGRTAAVANVGRDITDYRAIGAKLRQAQKLESIGRLAGTIAHNFNNLLTVITGYSDALLQKELPSSPSYNGLCGIRKAADKAADLTRELLAFSRNQPVNPVLLNLNLIVQELEQLLRPVIRPDIRLEIALDPMLGLVRADPSQIHQVLLNLAVNARDAMPRGGALTITSSNIDNTVAGNGQPYPLAAGSYVQLTITDTGSGMAEEVLSHIFEPFFTTKEPSKGSGLGLSTAYGIIQQHEGQIEVESKPDQGSTFRIFLPRVQAM